MNKRLEQIAILRKDLKPGTRVRTHRDYTSLVVTIIIDGDDPVTATALVVYKDGNKYKRRGDYHCDEIQSFLFNVCLYMDMYEGKGGAGKLKSDED